ncbi:MAG: hypothetical protein R2736_20835 [Solirubrobacterales bacterium]
MELASMLAGEPFTDRPACADPVIGGLLRAYNDTVDHARRQDLYAVASTVVGTAAGEELERARAARCVAFAEAHRRRSRFRGRRRRPLALAAHLGKDAPGVLAVRALGRADDAAHAELLALVDELVSMGRSSRPAVTAPPRSRRPDRAGASARPRRRAGRRVSSPA